MSILLFSTPAWLLRLFPERLTDSPLPFFPLFAATPKPVSSDCPYRVCSLPGFACGG
ncbi:MAG: hypothetical protein LBG17_10220 [Bacteroidales bacterium]|nr:hypothetical protein [Bacteroidales bacterium]